MIENALQDAKEYAQQNKDIEACGLIIVVRGKAKFVQCENVAEKPYEEFAISPKDYAFASKLGEVVAVVHSHPRGTSDASPRDLKSHQVSGLDWYIIGGDGSVSSYPAVSVSIPLYGREFNHGITDCYTFVRDWYAEEFEIDLPDFYRPDSWWNKGYDLYAENYAQAGFVKVAAGVEYRHGDLLVFAIGSSVGNHGAVYVDHDKLAHHLYGRLSCTEFYSGFYRDRLIHHLRHTKKS